MILQDILSFRQGGSEVDTTTNPFNSITQPDNNDILTFLFIAHSNLNLLDNVFSKVVAGGSSSINDSPNSNIVNVQTIIQTNLVFMRDSTVELESIITNHIGPGEGSVNINNAVSILTANIALLADAVISVNSEMYNDVSGFE
eukprot:scaffold164314_cov37-Prasinocladus_malaysianus.AAC.2